MTTSHFHQTPSLTLEQYFAALTDFRSGRSKLFGKSPDDYLRADRLGRTEANVTEGSGHIWERPHYDWSDSTHVVLTTTDSNLWVGASGHIYTFMRRGNGRTHADADAVREGKDVKGRMLGRVLRTAGRAFWTRPLSTAHVPSKLETEAQQ